MAVAPNNPIYLLAMKGLDDKPASLSRLLMYIEGLKDWRTGESPPDHRRYEELLEWLENLKEEEYADFRCYVALITFMVAVAWSERYWALQAAIALSGYAETSNVILPLAGLRRLTNTLEDSCPFDLRALTAGLLGLFELVSNNSDIPISGETLARLDFGLAYTDSADRRPILFWLLWNTRFPGTKFAEKSISRREDLEELNVISPQRVRDALVANYLRIFLGRRCHRETEYWFEKAKELAPSYDDNREILDTPGVEYLEWQVRTELQIATHAYENGIRNALNVCTQLLAKAIRWIDINDFWGLQYPVLFTIAEVQLESYRWDPGAEKEHAASARWFAVNAAWRSRRGSRDFYAAAARSLLAHIYENSGQIGKARLIWNQLLRRAVRPPSDPIKVWSTASNLGRISLGMGDARSAKEYCVTAFQAATQKALGPDAIVEPAHRLSFASLLDDAIAACALTNDVTQAVGLWEEWYSGRLLRQRLSLPPLTEPAVRQALPSGTGIAYLTVSSIGSSVHLVTSNGNDSRWVKDFRLTDLKRALGPYFKSRWRFHQNQDAETAEMFRDGLSRTLQSLDMLVRPLLELVKVHGLSRLVLVPGRGVGLIPLHAVLLAEERADTYFGDKVDILYAPNATVWVWASERQQRKRRASSDIFFGLSYPGDIHSDFSMEVEKAAALWGESPDSIKAGTAATAAALRAGVQHAEVLHISCHGWFSLSSTNEDPEIIPKAGLALADGDLDWRTLQDDLELSNSRLVVLSACETLVTSHRDQFNEQSGLPYAFLAIGAPLILGTNWVVEGMPTKLLVTRFHENLTKQQPLLPSAALGEAQAWLRNCDVTQVREALAAYFGTTIASEWTPPDQEVKLPYRHPYYWAGFRLIGADFSEKSVVEK